MIQLTKIKGDRTYFINADLIETIKSRPDTIIELVTGNQYICKESPEEVIEKIIAYNQRILQPNIERSEING